MIRRSPLHLIKDTSMFILSEDAISLINSEDRSGSFFAPVKRELKAIEVTGPGEIGFGSVLWKSVFVFYKCK